MSDWPKGELKKQNSLSAGSSAGTIEIKPDTTKGALREGAGKSLERIIGTRNWKKGWGTGGSSNQGGGGDT